MKKKRCMCIFIFKRFLSSKLTNSDLMQSIINLNIEKIDKNCCSIEILRTTMYNEIIRNWLRLIKRYSRIILSKMNLFCFLPKTDSIFSRGASPPWIKKNWLLFWNIFFWLLQRSKSLTLTLAISITCTYYYFIESMILVFSLSLIMYHVIHSTISNIDTWAVKEYDNIH